ncbi:MAG: hypothetical protein HYZ90_04135 [Candidatus Omnitrophica bacterium]|nr:hypothetical protein [Candidatus Omnitrophota bacterium]
MRVEAGLEGKTRDELHGTLQSAHAAGLEATEELRAALDVWPPKFFPVQVEGEAPQGSGVRVTYGSISGFVPGDLMLNEWGEIAGDPRRARWVRYHRWKMVEAVPIDVPEGQGPIFALILPQTTIPQVQHLEELLNHPALFRLLLYRKKQKGEIEEFLSWLLSNKADPRPQLSSYSRHSWEMLLLPGQRLEIVRWLKDHLAAGVPEFLQQVASDRGISPRSDWGETRRIASRPAEEVERIVRIRNRLIEQLSLRFREGQVPLSQEGSGRGNIALRIGQPFSDYSRQDRITVRFHLQEFPPTLEIRVDRAFRRDPVGDLHVRFEQVVNEVLEGEPGRWDPPLSSPGPAKSLQGYSKIYRFVPPPEAKHPPSAPSAAGPAPGAPAGGLEEGKGNKESRVESEKGGAETAFSGRGVNDGVAGDTGRSQKLPLPTGQSPISPRLPLPDPSQSSPLGNNHTLIQNRLTITDLATKPSITQSATSFNALAAGPAPGAPAGGLEQPQSLDTLIQDAVAPVTAITEQGRPVALLIDPSLTDLSAAGLEDLAKRLRGINRFPMISIAFLTPENEAHFRLEGRPLIRLVPDRPDAAVNPNTLYATGTTPGQPILREALPAILTGALALWQKAQVQIQKTPLRIDVQVYLQHVRGLNQEDIWQVLAVRFA